MEPQLWGGITSLFGYSYLHFSPSTPCQRLCHLHKIARGCPTSWYEGMEERDFVLRAKSFKEREKLGILLIGVLH